MMRTTMVLASLFLIAGCEDQKHGDDYQRHEDRDHHAGDHDRDHHDRNHDRDRHIHQQAHVAGRDADFLRDVAMANLTEIEAGRAAQRNAASDDVRRYGQRMIDDHGKAQAELQPLARRLSVDLPETLDDAHRDMVSNLSDNSRRFDHEYINMMVSDHQTVIARFEDAAHHADDGDVRSFASRMLPTLREHLRTAQEIDARQGGR